MIRNSREAILRLFFSIAVVIFLSIAWKPALAGTISFPSSLKEIESEAFYGDTSLDDVILPDGMSKIGARAFANSSVRKIHIPKSITFITSNAFSGCDNILAEVYENSYAHLYCEQYSIPYTIIRDAVFAIYHHPENATVEVGNTVTLSIEASGAEEFAWQISTDNGDNWRIFSFGNTNGEKNTVTITGVRGNTEQIYYRCRVTNVAGEMIYSNISTVTVIESSIPVSGITIDRAEITLNKGNSQTLVATIEPENATDKTIIWESDNTSVATVNQTGKVIVVGAGIANISAYSNDGLRMAVCKVYGVINATAITLDKTSLSLFIGETTTLKAVTTPSNTTQTVEWSSSNESVATIDPSGRVSALNLGSATISAQINGKTSHCSITVTDYSVSISPSNHNGILPDLTTWDLSIAANADWTASSDSSWLTVASASGTGNGKIKVTAAKNTTTGKRTGKITILCGSKSAVYTCIQNSYSISVSPTSKTNIASKGDDVTINLSANGNWTAKSDSTWLTVSNAADVGDTGMRVTAATNTTTSSRTGKITFSCGTASAVFTLQQNPHAVGVEVRGEYGTYASPETWNPSYYGATYYMRITTNGSWKIECNADWLSFTKKTGTDTTELQVTVDEWTSTSSTRSSTIKITCGTATKTMSVFQDKRPILNITGGPGTTASSVAHTYTYTIESNGDWRVSPHDDASEWMTITPTSGSGNGTITVKISQNTGINSRYGNIDFVRGSLSTTRSITQNPSETLSVDPVKVILGKDSSSCMVTVNHNAEYTVSSDSSWLSVSPTYMYATTTGKSTITIKANANSGSSQRTGNVTIKCGDLTINIPVTQKATDTISINPASATGGNPDGGSVSPSITASNDGWTAQSDSSWLTLSITSGKCGTTKVTMNYSKNTTNAARTATVTLTCGTATTTYKLTQNKHTVTLNPTTATGGVPDGNSASISVTANGAWTAKSNSSWLKLKTSSGSSGTSTLTMTYDKNTTSSARTATVTVTCGTASASYKLTQNKHSVSLSSTSQSITPNGAVNSISVTANGAWSATKDSAWITLDKTTGSGSGAIKVTVPENTTAASRIGKVTVTCGTASTSYTVTQSAYGNLAVASISVPKSTYKYTETVPYSITISGGKAPYTVKVVEYLDGAKKYEHTFNDSSTSYSYIADFTSGGTNYIMVSVTDSRGKTATKQSGNVAIEVPVSKITIKAANGATLTQGQMNVLAQSTLSAQTEPSNATNTAVKWTSSDSSTITIDESTGKFQALKAGTVTITATAKDGYGTKSTCTITAKAISVTITPEKTNYNVGETCFYEISIANCTTPLTIKCYEYYNGSQKATYTFENNSNTGYGYYGNLDNGSGTYYLKAEVTDAKGQKTTVQSPSVTAKATTTVIASGVTPTVSIKGESATFSWVSVNGATEYDLYFYAGSTAPTTSTWGNQCSDPVYLSSDTLSYTQSFAPGTYHIWMAAVGSGEGNWKYGNPVKFTVSAPSSSGRTTSSSGISFIKTREGSGHLTAYWDSLGGKWTIGYGHTNGVYQGQTITEVQAEQFLREDLNSFETIVNDFCSNNGISLTQSQFDALVSFTFNAGSAYLTNSGYKLHDTLIQYKNGSSIPIDKAFRMLGAVHHASGSCVAGLFYRRCDEGTMFYYGKYNVKYDWRTDYSWWGKSGCANLMPNNWYPYEYGYSENSSTVTIPTGGIVISGISIGYGDGDYFTKNGKSCATSYFSNGRCHKHDICEDATDSHCNCMRYWPSIDNCQVDLESSQCFGFARFCEWKVYGCYDHGYEDNDFSKLSGSVSANSCTEAYIKNLIINCSPATHMRLGGTHSICVVYANDYQVYWVDCNSDGYCKVVEHYQNWSDFASYVKGKGGITYVMTKK